MWEGQNTMRTVQDSQKKNLSASLIQFLCQQIESGWKVNMFDEVRNKISDQEEEAKGRRKFVSAP
jgi:hypothetical protein